MVCVAAPFASRSDSFYTLRHDCNQLTWLDNAHRKLDEAMFAAYGWPSDLSDDDLLARLLALNWQRVE